MLASNSGIPRNNNDSSLGFYFPDSDAPAAVVQRHGNAFLVTTIEVQKLLAIARNKRYAVSMSAATANKAMFWHRSLGCLSWLSLRRLRGRSQNTFTDAEFNAARAIPCDGCLKGRMTKPRVYKQSHSIFEKPGRPFQHFQDDIMVNRSTTSRKGFKYVLILVCVLTRVVYGYGMKRKSDTLLRFKR